jgi:hypothetical protein
MRVLRAVVLLWLPLLACSYSLATVRIRSTSDNGSNGSQQFWKLLEYSQPRVLTATGVKVSAVREVVCVTPEGGSVNAGECSGAAPYAYLFIFQLQSTSTKVKVEIGDLLPGFAEAGIMQCNDTAGSEGNNEELCTEDTSPPSLAALAAAMTATPSKGKSTTSVTFEIPDFPAFPLGATNAAEEGQGLTIYVLINQSEIAPVTLPTVGVSTY